MAASGHKTCTATAWSNLAAASSNSRTTSAADEAGSTRVRCRGYQSSTTAAIRSTSPGTPRKTRGNLQAITGSRRRVGCDTQSSGTRPRTPSTASSLDVPGSRSPIIPM